MWFRRQRIDEEGWDRRNNEVVQLTNGRNLDEALSAGKALYDDCAADFGREHLHSVTALNNLGIIQTLRREFPEAESYLLLALQISEKVCGEISREVAAVNMNLANLYTFKAQSIMERVKGTDET